MSPIKLRGNKNGTGEFQNANAKKNESWNDDGLQNIIKINNNKYLWRANENKLKLTDFNRKIKDIKMKII